MDDIKNLQIRVACTFKDAFGRTPLRERLDDIMGEALELNRSTDLANMREELGDLLSSAIQLANENDWAVHDLVTACIEKIHRRSRQYQSLGRKIKVALLGGAFNPPHNGHIQLAQFVLNTSKTFDEVWLVPCYQHMDGKEMVAPEHRVKMCEIAGQQDGRIKDRQ
jgi:cytidyltransferase-like protein